MITMLEAKHEPAAFKIKEWMRKFNVDKQTARRMVNRFQQERVYKSACGTYQCNVRDVPAMGNWPAMVHLSIKRVDREAFHDWRILQDIKNSVLSPEHEAVELYPAESRLWDTANQYHLWAFADPTHAWPFGFTGRNTMEHDEHDKTGAKQRPLHARKHEPVKEQP